MAVGNISIATVFYNLGQWVGIVGFINLSILIISGDLSIFLNRFFGLDKVIKFQRKFSLFTAVFILLHPLFFIISDFSYIKYLINPDFTLLPFTLGIISFYIFIIVMIASHIYKLISYKIWQYIHILTYFLFFFSLYHALNWGSHSNNPLLRIIYGFLFITIIFSGIYRSISKIRKINSSKFYLKKIKSETEDTFTIVLEGKERLRFKSGQFCFLRLNKNNLHSRHPFTISSSPHEENLSFTIKNTGRFTKTVLELKMGEEILVDGPFGIFNLINSKKNIVFIAGGIGITPFFSMIKDNFQRKEKQNILLLYGTKTKKDLIFKKYLDNIKEKWFKKVYVLTREPISSPQFENTYIDKNLIKKYVKNVNDSLFYVCGPKSMEDNIKKSLIDLGVNKKNIIIEDFFW